MRMNHSWFVIILRFKVEIDTNSPITIGYLMPWMLLLAHQNVGSKLVIESKYKRLLEFCFKCGMLDHVIDEYNYSLTMQYKVSESVYIPLFDVWLRASFEKQSSISHYWSPITTKAHIGQNQRRLTNVFGEASFKRNCVKVVSLHQKTDFSLL